MHQLLPWLHGRRRLPLITEALWRHCTLSWMFLQSSYWCCSYNSENKAGFLWTARQVETQRLASPVGFFVCLFLKISHWVLFQMYFLKYLESLALWKCKNSWFLWQLDCWCLLSLHGGGGATEIQVKLAVGRMDAWCSGWDAAWAAHIPESAWLKACLCSQCQLLLMCVLQGSRWWLLLA